MDERNNSSENAATAAAFEPGGSNKMGSPESKGGPKTDVGQNPPESDKKTTPIPAGE